MHLRSIPAICFCLIGFATFAQVPQDRPYVLLSAHSVRGMAGLIREFDVGSYGSWQPSSADVANLEAALPHISEMKAVKWHSKVQIEHPRSYFRQYIGVSHRGVRRVFVNAFCDSPPPADWHDRLVVVLDGGTCYWQALYDPATKTFSDLTINGRA